MRGVLPMLALGAALLQVGGVAAGPSEAQCEGVRLDDVSRQVGLDFVHQRGRSGMKHLPETMGAGLAWLDFDGDGWWDLYLVQSGTFPPADERRNRSRLYRNVSGSGFVEVANALPADNGYGQGVLASDLDGDGSTDLVLTYFSGQMLLYNTGNGAFERQGRGLATGSPGWSSSAAAADADGDGDLDLYVSRYLDYDPAAPLFCGDAASDERRYCDPALFRGLGDLFFVNEGEGQFREATEEAGLGSADGRGLGVVFTDLDGDRWPDLYVANDLTPNLLFHNLGDGTFEDVSLLSGSAVDRNGKPEAGMGVAVADLDGDERPDLLVTNFDVETNTYYANRGELSFLDISASSGFGPPSFNMLAFGIGVADLNGDGRQDVYVANGHIFEQPRRDNTAYRQRDQVLLGDGAKRFREARCKALDERRSVARGLALADYDGDGDIDIALQENGGPAALLRNDAPAASWLGVRLVGTGPNSEAIGARVRLNTSKGAHLRWILAGDSYQSSSDRRALFPLAPDEKAMSLEVIWPSGRRLELGIAAVDRYLTLREGGASTSG